MACLLTGTILFLVAGVPHALTVDDPAPRLVLEKRGAPLIAPGGGVTYTLVVSNAGATTATGVVLTDTMDAPLGFVDATDGGVSLDDRTVRWALPDLAAGEGVSVRLSAHLPVTAPLGLASNRAAVTAGSTGGPLADDAMWTSEIMPTDLSVNAVAAVGSVVAGDPMTVTIAVTNEARIDAEDVAVDVEFAGNTSWITDTSRVAGFQRVIAPGRLRLTRTSVAAMSNEEVAVVVLVSNGATVGAGVSHTATVSSGTLDDNLMNNVSVSDPVRVDGAGPPDHLDIEVPEALTVGGEEGEVDVLVYDRRGRPVEDGTAVTLDTTMGRLEALNLLTASGLVTTTLVSGEKAGLASVRARAGSAGASRGTRFVAGPAHELDVETDTAVPTVGDEVALRAEVRDRFGNLVQDGTSVRGTAEHGTVAPDPAWTIGGRAELVWRNTTAGLATATLTSGDAWRDAELRFRPSVPAGVVVEVAPEAIGIIDGRAAVTATVRDAFGNDVEDGWPVSFGTVAGALEPQAAETVSGSAAVKLLAGPTVGEFPVWAASEGAQGESEVDLRPTAPVLQGAAWGPRGRARETRTYPGETLLYEVTVWNRDLATARDVYLATALSDVLDVTTVTASDGVTPTDRPPPGLDPGSPPGHSRRYWRLPDLGSGEAVTLTLAGRLDPARRWESFQTLFFRTVVTTTTPVGSAANLSLTDQAGVYAADYYVSSRLNTGASILSPGGIVAYDIDFGNNTAADDGVVRVTDTLPAGTVFDHWQPGPRTVVREVGTFGPGSSQLVWEADGHSAAAGQLRLWLLIDESVPGQSLLENVLEIGGTVFDLDESNNRFVDGVWLLGVNLTATVDGPATVAPGETLRYEIRVGNRAAVDAATNVVVESLPPRGLTVMQTDPPGELVAGGRVRWRLSRLVAGGDVVLAMDVQVPNTAVVGSTYQHTVDVSSLEPESYPIDNRASLITRVVPGTPTALDLEVDKATLRACSDDTASLRAHVLDGFGNPVADGTSVYWTATAGVLSNARSETSDGTAAVELAADPRAGQATVSARFGSLTDAVLVTMVPGAPVALAVSADPMGVGKGGDTLVTVNVLDGCGNAVADGWPIELEAERGAFRGGSRRLILSTADSMVRARLLPGDVAGPLRITARYGSELGEAVITVLNRRASTPLFLPFLDAS